ncbi:flagellar basal body protein FliL [Campylobacter sp. MIT 99-7217]|uniref:flagellar basal body-associated protein FliL n=1 Tax=Campylobacter sp. MIT 99-7217 TaxID=535091 RepID=UPI00115BDFA2|nr:flagellar basal body-associated protein FliL [Campylobacter sp. MIT 99-7217]TQR34414.1 flagellar basal body protein FliL [Campylobacter sp. MIT 99-7217]
MEEQEVEATEPKKKGGSLVLIIVIFLFVLLLVVLGAIAFLMLSSPADEAEAAPAATTTTAAKETKGAGAAAGAKANNAQRGSDYANIGPMFPLAPFTLNLLSESGARFVKCTIQLEQSTELLTPELEKKTAIIRDVVIRTLTSKTFEEVSTTKGKERLKDELVGRVNEILTDGFVKNIYFTDFVVQ